MKERVFAAVREMKREQWLICGLAGLLLLVIAAPVKQKEQKKDTGKDNSFADTGADRRSDPAVL